MATVSDVVDASSDALDRLTKALPTLTDSLRAGQDALTAFSAKMDALAKSGDRAKMVDLATGAINKLSTAATTSLRSMDSLLPSFRLLDNALAAISYRIARFVETANPAVVVMYTLAVRDLQAVIGRALVPVLQDATRLMRGLADAFVNLSPQTQKLFASLIAAGVAGTVAAGAIAATAAAIVALTNPVVRIGAAVLALGTAFARSAEGATILRAIGDRVSMFLDTISGVVGDLVDAVSPLVIGLLSLGSAITAIPLTILQGVASVAAGLVRVIATVVEKLAQVVQYLLTQVAGAIATIAKGIGDVFDVIIRKLNYVLRKLGQDELATFSDKRQKSSVGAAVVPFSSGSLEDVGTQSRIRAFSQGVDPQTEQLMKIRQVLENVAGAWASTRAEDKATGQAQTNLLARVAGALLPA